LDIKNIDEEFLMALKFELRWLTSKREYCSAIYDEDEKKLKALSAKWMLIPRGFLAL
jgi:hypothetical protein